MDESRKRPPQNTHSNTRGGRKDHQDRQPGEQAQGQSGARGMASRGRGSDPNTGGNGEGARKRSLSDYKPGATESADEPSPAEQPTLLKGGGLLQRFRSGQAQAGAPGDGSGDTGAKASGGSQGKARGSTSDPKAKGAGSDAGDGQRAPRAGEWSASDFDSHELEAWDHHDDAPFELPESPDDTYERTIQDARKARERSRSGASYQRYEPTEAGRDRRDTRNTRGRRAQDADWSSSGAYQAYDPYDSRERRSAGRRSTGWDDVDDDIEWDDGWDDGWQTGEWDTGWATGMRPATTRNRSDRDVIGDDWADDDDGYDPRREPVGYGARAANQRPGQSGRERCADDEEDALSQSLNTLAQLSAVGAPLSRLARVRMLFRRRPTAAAMLAFFLLGFMLTCCAPMIPLVRLGYDASDAYSRVTKLQAMLAGGSSSLLNTQTLADMHTQLAGLSQDLYEINGAVNVAGAPIGAVSSSARNYRLLVRMGYDLTTAGDEAVQMAQIVLTPLAGGALAATGSPGLQPSDMQHARNLLADADAYVSDALSAYNAINPATLPKQLQPGSKYGKLLAELPLAPAVFNELKTLLDAAPALLGIGQPAYYLVVAMDNSELRPGGGFQGNYGVLEIDGGKQSANKFSLDDTYNLDGSYATKHTQSAAADPNCPYTMPEPPNYYWWWPIRCIPPGQSSLGWGLRDSNLSPDFPTNARTAMQITEDAGEVRNNAPLQGEVAFTPALIAQLLTLTGNITLPDFNNVTVTPQNLEVQIHEHQLGSLESSAPGRKTFTHELGSVLLTKLKSLHGSALKNVFKVAVDAIKSKDLQVYLADPRAELILQQLNMASTVATGNGDGFFVVDTNDGGNKANAFVTEHQTDVVTLLPNGGAYHQLEIKITYNKTGSVYSPYSRDYNDLQRTYLPGDATIAGWSGFNPVDLAPAACNPPPPTYATFVTDCTAQHGIFGVSTNSDIPGRTMVLGALTVLCGPYQHVAQLNATTQGIENDTCDTPKATSHTTDIFLSWYTPHASTFGANGHGTWSELVEKQAGSNSQLTVYIANGHSVNSGNPVTDDATFQSLLQSAKKIYDQPLATNTTVTYTF